MANYNPSSYEFRTIQTSIQTIVVPTAVFSSLDFTTLSSTDNLVFDLENMTQGSIVTETASTGTTQTSPIPNNTTDIINGTFGIRRQATSIRLVVGSTAVLNSSVAQNNIYVLLLCVDMNNKCVFFFTAVLRSNENLIYTEPTTSEYGYFTLQNYTGVIYIPIGTQMNYPDLYNTTTTTMEETTDPYDDGGTSDGGGGTGDFDDTSDTVSEPSLPSISGLNTGFFTAFVCSNSEMQNVSNYLWNNLITDILDPTTQMADKIDALKKVVSNPYDAIMGCSIVPVSPSIAGSKEVKMYGLVQTGITLNYASSRWVRVDCGTLNINEYWGAYLDYSPYTKTTSLYLPYIGTVSIDIDLIMGKAVQVIYHVDILSGICIAYILINGSVEFQYQGQCSTQIPITNADYSGTIQAGIGLVGNVSNIVAGAVGGASGGIGGAVVGATASAVSQTPSIVGNVMGMKPDIKSGGSVGSSGGILGVQKPYLIIERPRQSLPKNQNSYTGYPCNRQMKVKDCVGYTEFEDIKLENIPLTDGEKEELERILSEGVILV